MTTWLIIANAAEAQIYNITNMATPGMPPLVKKLEHPESRKKAKDIFTDGIGSYNAGVATGQYEPHTSWHEDIIREFAHELARFLNDERNHQHYEKLVLCAAPHFYGLMMDEMNEQVKKHIVHHLEKDYIPFTQEKLLQVIEQIREKAL